MTLDPQILERAREWTGSAYDAETRDEVQALLDANDENEIRERFGAQLEFGTGGLRGVVGAGTNRMNRYTAGAASLGLANYILKNIAPGQTGSVVISYDSRTHSAQFASEAAQIFAAAGVKAFLYDTLHTTPELSFAVRHLGATAGIMITASHNPKQYNGFKAYWSDGAQVIPPHDKGIIDEVLAIASADEIKFADFESAKNEGMIELIGKEVDEAYLEAIEAVRLAKDLDPAISQGIKIIYTPLHGTGGRIVPKALARWGFTQVQMVPEQAKPDGTFPTAPKPNPEEREAMQMALDLAAKEQADLVMATDPDSDRIGIAVPDKNGDYQLMNGNQAASLMAHYVIERLKEQGTLPEDGAIVKTIVTTELIKSITEAAGLECVDVLTGFKWIGAKIRVWEEAKAMGKPSKTYLFGGEESYGYLAGTHARDKDAVVIACMIAEIAAWTKSQGKTLLDLLDELFDTHGVHLESLESLEKQGLSGMEEIAAMMEKIRENPPEHIGGYNVEATMDLQMSTITHGAGGESEKIDLPKSNVMHFTLHNGGKVVARPSGTEPKIKFYFGAKDTMLPPPHLAAMPLAERKEACQRILGELRDDLFAYLEDDDSRDAVN